MMNKAKESQLLKNPRKRGGKKEKCFLNRDPKGFTA